MNTSSRRLLELATRACEGATREQIATSVQRASLPGQHRDLLALSNGLSLYGGYYRLFGVQSHMVADLFAWNDPDLWKFAWGGEASEYLCIGESAWGDQFAYRLSDLEKARQPIYELSAFTMTAERLADDFGDFVDRILLRVAVQPYDEMSTAARSRLGELPLDMHVAYNPPLLLGGVEHVENIVALPAVVAMVANGDIAMQLRDETFEREVRAIEAYTDDRGRARLRVEWA